MRPPHKPTGAVLRLANERPEISDEFVCLDLVSRGDVWFPLSEAGALTYAHSSGLLTGEKWTFTCFDEEGRPTVFEALREKAISRDEVRELYGTEAANRARPDRNTVQLRLRRVED